MTFPESAWSDTELDDSILSVCDEFPYATLAACSRALEHSRHTTPRGTAESLRAAMRESLQGEPDLCRATELAAA